MSAKPEVLVLGGGPDAEREVSLVSSRCVAEALRSAGHAVNYQVIDRPDAGQLAGLRGEVVFPVLHGGWGEGGPLQDLLEASGRPYIGCRARAARMAMDKLATKLLAAQRGVATAEAAAFNDRDAACPLGEMPVVLKPVHEGSSVGVHICRTPADWDAAVPKVLRDRIEHPARIYMVERAVLGARELTVGVVEDGGAPVALAPIEIKPAVEFYDYQAKYTRDDTRYLVDPPLPPGAKDQIQAWALAMFNGLGCRHLARVDFLLDHASAPWLLEVNTMPGFTDHSLLPMGARHRGMEMPALCAHLVTLAARGR